MEILYACVRTTSITTLDLALYVRSYNFGQILSLLALCIDRTFETKHRRNTGCHLRLVVGMFEAGCGYDLLSFTIFFKIKSFIFYCDDWKEESQLVDPENATPALTPSTVLPFRSVKKYGNEKFKK